MEEFKGTKGKWQVKHSESKPAFNVIGTRLGAKYKIARCPYIAESEFDKYKTQANARLISKAPEMLDLLIGLKETMRELDGWREEYNKISKIIKEATEIK